MEKIKIKGDKDECTEKHNITKIQTQYAIKQEEGRLLLQEKKGFLDD